MSSFTHIYNCVSLLQAGADDKEDAERDSTLRQFRDGLDSARNLVGVLKREKWRLNKREMSVELRMGELEDYKTHLKSDMVTPASSRDIIRFADNSFGLLLTVRYFCNDWQFVLKWISYFPCVSVSECVVICVCVFPERDGGRPECASVPLSLNVSLFVSVSFPNDTVGALIMS